MISESLHEANVFWREFGQIINLLKCLVTYNVASIFRLHSMDAVSEMRSSW